MARMRSPNYPAISLKQAIDLIALIYKSDRENAINKEVAALHMGYSGLTGRTLKLMGALSQFGLLDKVGKGEVRVSKTAVSILHGIDDKERLAALAVAGRSPSLFRAINEAFVSPSDRTIESFLLRQGFTDSAVPPVIKSYRETSAFLAREGVSESYGVEDDADTDSSDDEVEENISVQTNQQRHGDNPPPPPPPPPANKTDFDSGELSLNFDMRTVSVKGRTSSPSELREFIASLSQLQELFEKVAPARKEASDDIEQGKC